MMAKGELLFEGVANFPAMTGADGVSRYIDVPSLPLFDPGFVELSVRNGSLDADSGTLAVDVGHLRTFRPYPKPDGVWALATGTAATDLFTSVNPHGLKVGDRVIFKVGPAGGDAGASVTIPYYVVNDLGLMTDRVFQVTAIPGGKGAGSAQTLLNVDAAEEVFFRYLASPLPDVGLPPASIESDDNIFTTLVPHGLVVGDAVEVRVATTDCNLVRKTIYYVLATATLTTFTVAPGRGGTIFDPCAAGDLAGIVMYLAQEFVSLTSFSVPVFAAGTYLVNPTGLVSKIVQGFAAGPEGGRITISPAAQNAAAFAVAVQIRRA